jgi:hypothetical protein
MTSNKAVRDKLKALEIELADKVKERDLLNVTIVQLQSQVKALSNILITDALVGRRKELENAAIGLTEMIRTVLRLTAEPMQPAAIKNMLTVMGFDFSSFSNPSAAVHNTLKRMASNGELLYTDAKGYALPGLNY